MRLLQTLVILLISVVGYSQNYQRLFATNDGADVSVIDALQDDAGSTYVVSKYVTEDLENEGLFISKHNLKGDIDWSNEIRLEGDYEITRYGDMQSIGQDSFLIAFQVKRDSVYSQALLRTGRQGASEWSYNYYANTDSTNTARPVEIALRDTTRIVVAGTRVDTMETMSLWTVDNTGIASAFETNYQVSDTLNNVYSYNFSEIDYDPRDTTYVVSGKMLVDSTQLFVARLDSTYGQVWARSYHLPAMESAQIYQQLLTDSGEIVIVGTARPDFTRGFVAKLDTSGDVAWFITLNFPSPLSGGTVLTSAGLGLNGEIVIGGSYLENFVFAKPFMLAMDQDGSRLWERQYSREPIVQYDLTSGITDLQEHLTIMDQGNIIAAPDGGYVQVNTVQTVSSNLRLAININKTDEEGNSFRVEGETATCDSDIDLVQGMTAVEQDTLIFVGDALFEVSNPVTVIDTSLYVDIGAPILGLFADVQCPDDINVVLDATLLNAETYEWNTGDSTAMITVMDTEEYTVTVTFDTETCFQLCDTVAVPVYEPLEGFIDLQERERWCGEPREFVLEGFASGGSGDYFYAWEGGELTKSIVRNIATADYTITISDSCGQDTVITRTIFDTEFEQPDDADILVDCADNGYVLTLITSGSTFDLSTIVWSTGETGVSSISVTEEQVVSVTVVDDCFYTISASTDLNDVSTSMQLSFDGGSYCSDGVIFVGATFSPNNFFTVANLTWSTGSNDNGQQAITVTEFGEYTATITDDCGNVVTASIDVPDLSQEPEMIIVEITCTGDGVTYTITNPEDLDESSIEWNDALGNILALGQTSITVDNDEEITITATDDCQNIVTIMEQVMMEPVVIDIAVTCNSDGFIYSITNPGDILANTIVWTNPDGSTIAQGQLSVEVELPQTVTVTAIDDCQNEVTSTLQDSFEEVELTIDVDCGENSTTLSAQASGSVFWDKGYTWAHTSDKSPSITVSEPGVYMVEVDNICGDSTVTSITLNQGDFFPCECVSWPNLIATDGAIMDLTGMRDASFGPVVNCGGLVTNYNLWIYNAYGNLIYSTEAAITSRIDPSDPSSDYSDVIGVNWNGQLDNIGERLPSGVYKYFSTYTVDGEAMEKKGELTLVR